MRALAIFLGVLAFIGLLTIPFVAHRWIQSGFEPEHVSTFSDQPESFTGTYEENPGIVKGRERLPPALRSALESGESFVLLQVDPLPASMREELGSPPIKLFHDYGILHVVPIDNRQDRRELLDALYKNVSDVDYGPYMKCFNPRHGISVTRSNLVVDLLICFECYQIRAFSNQTNCNYGWTTLAAPSLVFDAHLQRARQP